MIKRKIITATLVAVGLFVSLGYRSVAQTGGGSMGAPSGSTTSPSDTTTPPGGGSTTPPGGSMGAPGGSTTSPSDTTTPSSGSTTSPTQNSLSSSDKRFMIQAAQGGTAEVQIAQLALNKASSDQVKQYAQEMIDQHSQANNQLAALAAQKGVTLPTTIGSKNQALYDQLSKLSGAAFDKAYINQAGVKAHSQQESLYKREAQKGKDEDVKAFATSILPTVEQHLQVARSLSSGKTAGTNSNQPSQSSPDSTTGAPSGGSMSAPSGGSMSAPSGGSMSAPGGSMSAPGGSMSAPGGGSTGAPGGAMTSPSPAPGQ